MTPHIFLYGPLCHPPLLHVVLGRDAATECAHLPGHVAHWANGRLYPALNAQPEAETDGLLLRDPSPEDRARLDFYMDSLALAKSVVTVQTEAGEINAQAYQSGVEAWLPGAPWDLADWQARYGQMVTATAGDVMALFAQARGAPVSGRYGAMLVRGAGRVRARQTAPTRVRRVADPGDVLVDARRQPYADYFAVEDYALRFRRFDGTFSPQISRAAFVSGDAVTVLPYDPVRDRVLLIEQFRVGPFARGDAQPWMLEPIAGRIDPGETPEQAARREAVEEAGLTLGDLIEVARYYPTPAAKTEFLYSYVALCDLPDGVAGVFGVEDETEDIRGHLIGFDIFMDLLASGEVAVGPLVITALWLQRERAALRGRDSGAGA